MTSQYNYNFQNWDSVTDQTQHQPDNIIPQTNTNPPDTQEQYKSMQNQIYSLPNDTPDHNNKTNELQQFSNPPLETSKQMDITMTNFQTEYLKKVKKMENWIGIIKQNAYEKHKTELEEKLLYKNELENNIEILTSYIKMNRVQKRNYGTWSKSILKENERLSNQSDRAIQDQYYITRELPYQRIDINKMQKEMIALNEETKNISNCKLQIEREIMTIEDDIRRLNKLNSDTFAEKENMKNSIKWLRRHSSLIKEKINFEDNKSTELFSSLTQLATLSQIESEAYDKRTAHFRPLTSLSTTFITSNNNDWSMSKK